MAGFVRTRPDGHGAAFIVELPEPNAEKKVPQIFSLG